MLRMFPRAMGLRTHLLTGDHAGPDGRGQAEQPKGVGDRGAVLADAGGDLFLREGKPVEQGLIGIRLLDRVQVLPLDIFDQGQFELMMGRGFLHYYGDFPEAGLLGRPPSPLPCIALFVVLGCQTGRPDAASRRAEGISMSPLRIGFDSRRRASYPRWIRFQEESP